MLKTFFLIVFTFISTNIFSQNIDSLKMELTKAKFPKEKVDIYLDLAKIYLNNPIDSLKIYSESALVIAKQSKLIVEEASALLNLGIYYSSHGEYEKALEYYINAHEKSENLSNETHLNVALLVSMANLYNNIGEYQKSIDKNMVALDIMGVQSGEFDIKKIGCYNSLGTSFSRIGLHDMALKYYKEMFNLCDEVNHNYGKMVALNNMGLIYRKKENYEKAIELCEEALKINNEEKNSKFRAMTLLNVSVSYLKIGKNEKVINYLNESLKIAEKENRLLIIADCHLYLAEAYAAQGKFEESYKEQTLYSNLREKELNKRKNAVKKDITLESDKKTEIIKGQEESMIELGSQKNKITLVGILSILLLSGLLFLFIKKKKLAEFEKGRLKAEYVILNEKNSELKTRLLNLAMNKLESYKSEKKPYSQPKYKNSSLTNEKRDEYMQLILDHMNTKRPYLDFEVNQSELAAELSISTHHFSEVLSICFEKNFYSFINIYRVDEAKKIIKNPKYEDYKILAIGYEAGFKSKTSFNRVFKDMVGLTPSEYKEKHTQVVT